MSLPVLTDSLQNYLVLVNRYPVLRQEEEREVAMRYFKHRRLEDAHKLVTSNLRYVVKIALEYRDYGQKIADLVQEGNIGLMVAVKKFDPHKGFRLITYATWWIRSFIQEFILKSTGIVRRGAKVLKKQLFYKKGGAKGDEHGLSEPMLYDRLVTNDLSLNVAIGDDDATHMELLRDSSPTHEELIIEASHQKGAAAEVQSALDTLSPKERVVIEKRVMADEPESLSSLGQTLGLTRERVRQIEAKALSKLRGALAPR